MRWDRLNVVSTDTRDIGYTTLVTDIRKMFLGADRFSENQLIVYDFHLCYFVLGIYDCWNIFLCLQSFCE